MRRVRSQDTAPELALRSALWRIGLRFRVNVSRLPGKPDIVFTRAKIAVFVDGDFWHGNQWRQRGFPSLEAQFSDAPNANYWIPKIRRNVERDSEVGQALALLGWRVIRIWESDLRKDLPSVVALICDVVQSSTGATKPSEVNPVNLDLEQSDSPL